MRILIELSTRILLLGKEIRGIQYEIDSTSLNLFQSVPLIQPIMFPQHSVPALGMNQRSEQTWDLLLPEMKLGAKRDW